MAEQNQILPNERFGAAFLDVKYKKFAALGEVVMDKITGELYLRRKADGRIVSFVQNDKYLHDIVLELNILMRNNGSFTFPNTTSSWFSSTDFNVGDMIGHDQDLLTNYTVDFPSNAIDTTKRFQFKVSTESNGFFIRPVLRDTDNLLMSYLTSFYNNVFQYYSGDNTDFTAEKAKFADLSYYRSNATITYSIEVTGLNDLTTVTKTYSYTKYIRTNEENFIPFPENIGAGVGTITDIVVSVNSLRYDKIDMSLRYMKSLGNFDTSMYDSLIAPDKQILLRAVNVFHFIDDIEDLPVNPNTVITALIDAVHLSEYVGYINKLSDGAGVIPAIERPSDDAWTTYNAWCEIIRIVKTGGQSIETDHPTDLDALEESIYKTSGVSVNFTFDPNSVDDIYIQSMKEV